MAQDLQVEVGQRHHGADVELLAQLLERRHVARLVEARNGTPVMRPRSGSNVVGLALSGGGIRSASFCLI